VNKTGIKLNALIANKKVLDAMTLNLNGLESLLEAPGRRAGC
jgi:hypothetical protein